jgi:hypothetical protein
MTKLAHPVWRLGDEAGSEVITMFVNDVLDDVDELVALFDVGTDFGSMSGIPAARSVERRAGEIGSKKRNAIQTQLVRCFDDVWKIAEIALLEHTPGRDWKKGGALPQGGYAIREASEGPRYTPDRIMNGPRSIQRDDDLVTPSRDRSCMARQKQSGTEKGDPDRQRL